VEASLLIAMGEHELQVEREQSFEEDVDSKEVTANKVEVNATQRRKGTKSQRAKTKSHIKS
jgi:hypothetical protein